MNLLDKLFRCFLLLIILTVYPLITYYYLSRQRESTQSMLGRSQEELKELRFQVDILRKEKEEVTLQAKSYIVAPKRILPGLEDNVELAPPGSKKLCRQHNCFDYSRCSLTSQFPVYYYKPISHQISESVDPSIRTSLMDILETSPYITFNADMACVYLVSVGDDTSVSSQDAVSKLETNLNKLPNWNGDGRNHVLLNLQRSESLSNDLKNTNTERAIVIQTHFEINQFRAGFDVVAPMLLNVDSQFDWMETPAQLPALRTFFLTFQAKRFSNNVATVDDTNINISEQNADNGKRVKSDLSSTKDKAEEMLFITEELEKLKKLKDDQFYIDFMCVKSDVESQETQNVEWGLCGDHNKRASILQQSTFALILANNDSIAFSTHLYIRLYEALLYGAIPVILGEHTQLPLNEFITWKKCVVILPKSRLSELYFFLKTISDTDILAMRRQGWFVWSTYLSSTEAITNGILATLRTRISIPPSIILSEPSPNVFQLDRLKKEEEIKVDDPKEYVGPIDPPPASPKYLRNFTTTIMDQEYIWNNPPGPEYLFPTLPNDPLLPTDARFIGSSQHEFRPIKDGEMGKAFQATLGGNVPCDQFTIVILTYKREKMLMSALERFDGLPYLNKVIVVWNSQEPPSADVLWPNIHVPIKVIKTKKNSLNNRFLPYDEIDTDAILSIDDDVNLNHEEMTFGFRVWREARDRIVGFPGRGHAWDFKNKNGFLYYYKLSCEVSMILTGAAFFHKYYSYVYSYIMPNVIRDKVDEYMNCEDIAMNFLVSHITRKPPIKVTSRIVFSCPDCSSTLHSDKPHYEERDKCIKFFTKVFGYTPLLNTQFRADSMLFQTRLPRKKQKCYKTI